MFVIFFTVNVSVTFLTTCQCHILSCQRLCHIPYHLSMSVSHSLPPVNVILYCQCLCHIPYHLSMFVIFFTVNVSVTFLTTCQYLSTFLTTCQCLSYSLLSMSLSHSLPPVNVIFFTVNVSVIFPTICQCLSYFLLSVIVSVIFLIICHCLFVSFFSFLVLHCPSWTIRVALPALPGYGTAAAGAALPFLPVCAVFSCVPTMLWLSVSGTF